MIDTVRSQTIEVDGLVHRIRSASRRLTGGDGQAPVPMNAAQAGLRETDAGERTPLLIDLTIRLESLNSVVASLREEVTYLETYGESAEDQGKFGNVVANTSGVAGTAFKDASVGWR